MKKSVKVFAPATVANFIVGYDIIGFALEEPGDIVEVSLNNKDKIEIIDIKSDYSLPFDIEKNTATIPILELLNEHNINIGLDIKIEKGLPIGSGLGSSAASAVAAIYALNLLLDERFSKIQLLKYLQLSEKMVSGSPHADNVAPSLLGGIVIIQNYNPLSVKKLNLDFDYYVSIITPDIAIKTKAARNMLPENVKLKDAVTQWANIAAMISALYEQDDDLLGLSLKDIIIEPVRANLIPYFYDMRDIALKKRAICFGISGSGPSVFFLNRNKAEAEVIIREISEFLYKKNISHKKFVTKINNIGPKVLDIK